MDKINWLPALFSRLTLAWIFIESGWGKLHHLDKITEYFTKIVTDHAGKVVKSEYWGLRSLSYKIKKNRKGHYVLLGLDAPADAVNELERQFKLHEDVMRSLTVRVDEISKEASAVLRQPERQQENRYSDTGRQFDSRRRSDA